MRLYFACFCAIALLAILLLKGKIFPIVIYFVAIGAVASLVLIDMWRKPEIYRKGKA